MSQTVKQTPDQEDLVEIILENYLDESFCTNLLNDQIEKCAKEFFTCKHNEYTGTIDLVIKACEEIYGSIKVENKSQDNTRTGEQIEKDLNWRYGDSQIIELLRERCPNTARVKLLLTHVQSLTWEESKIYIDWAYKKAHPVDVQLIEINLNQVEISKDTDDDDDDDDDDDFQERSEPKYYLFRAADQIFYGYVCEYKRSNRNKSVENIVYSSDKSYEFKRIDQVWKTEPK